MSRLEGVANVLLRVPCLMSLDLLYKWDMDGLGGQMTGYGGHVSTATFLSLGYYFGHISCFVLLLLPLRHLVKVYIYLLTTCLLYIGHQAAWDYIKHETEQGNQRGVFFDLSAFNQFAAVLTGQIILSTLCSFLMKTKHFWLFCAPVIPLLAHLCMVPLSALSTVNHFAMLLTGLEVLSFLASGLLVVYSLVKSATQVLTDLSQLLAVVVSLWSYLDVPVLFLVFWLVLFAFQVYYQVTSSWSMLTYQGLLFSLLNSIAECCGTPYSLLGLTFAVSYLALGLLSLCKFYLLGYAAFHNGQLVHRGVTEGVSLLLLALQTGLTDMQVLQRTFLLSIILFIVVTSTLQSMIEITSPIILALGASQSSSFWKHIRGISMCIFLLIFPCLMVYKLARLFHMDFWLLILVSTCMLTSLQVMGTIFIYTLFMLEPLRDEPLEKMDEIIYYVNAVSRVLEFLVAVSVVAYGIWESIIGEWSWVGASVIIIHSYFNVWLRAQSGWKSFLLRREAANKIRSLPTASQQQLQEHNDVCAICFQEMYTAVITPCEHFFHSGCLQKWLYVQDTCPMCHQQMKPPQHEASSQDGPRGTARHEPPDDLREEEFPSEEVHQSSDLDYSDETKEHQWTAENQNAERADIPSGSDSCIENVDPLTPGWKLGHAGIVEGSSLMLDSQTNYISSCTAVADVHRVHEAEALSRAKDRTVTTDWFESHSKD